MFYVWAWHPMAFDSRLVPKVHHSAGTATPKEVEKQSCSLTVGVALRILNFLSDYSNCFATIGRARVCMHWCCDHSTCFVNSTHDRTDYHARYTGGQTIRREVVARCCALYLRPCQLLCKYYAEKLAYTGIATVHQGQGSYTVASSKVKKKNHPLRLNQARVD